MKTIKLYDNDSYMTEFEATVLSCEKTDRGFAVVLDKTAFFPEEGGQNADSGTLGGAKVSYVSIKGGVITHYTDCELSGQVTGVIDWQPRFDKMQQHTGEHIVSGIIFEKYGFNNVGFHLGDDDVTFDFDGMLSREQLNEVEMLANEAIYKNLPVKASYPDNLAELEYRAKLDLTEDVRIVEIEGVDRCACCAPHVSTTGEVGIIKLLEAGSYKGGIRIHMACGKRAVADYQIKFDNLATIATALSSGKNNAAEFFERFAADTNELKQSISMYKKYILELKSQLVQKTDGNIILFEQDMDGGMIRNYVNSLQGKYGGVCAVFVKKAEGGYNFTAASDSIAMREMANNMRDALGARAGGSDKMIQGSVSATREQIEEFFAK